MLRIPRRSRNTQVPERLAESRLRLLGDITGSRFQLLVFTTGNRFLPPASCSGHPFLMN
ncbi:hypothetical protein SOVF_096920 [Spinacia oleracea]|nr:hypothetical protein SOVF_096920 [Spinacia oleracea]